MEITSPKTKLLSKRKLIYFVLTLIVFAVAFIFSVTSFKGQQYLKNSFSEYVSNLILVESYKIRASVDPLKFNYDRLFTGKPSSINITVSRKDIEIYNQQIRKGINQGFHRDEWKEWRKVDLQIGDDKFKKIKMKLHGTSVMPIVTSNALHSFIPRFYKKIGGDPHRKDFGLGELNASFKLKLSNEKFFNGIRQFSIITAGDDWDATSIALTKMAKNLGAIVSIPRLVHGNFNGADAGVYLMSEDIDKELLERNYGITNYGILKSNDIWDKAKARAHISMTDFTSHDKEQAGSLPASEYALGQFEILMREVKINNIQGVTRLIELDDFARFSALEHFYGENHASSGDNLRYIYNFSTGRFRLALRIEGGVVLKSKFSDPSNFDKHLGPYDQNIIFSLLLNSKEFIEKRRNYLDFIIRNKDRLLDDVKGTISEMYELSRKTSKDGLKKIHASMESLENLKFNIAAIEKYLTYHQVYISHVLTNSALEILNESTFAINVVNIKDCEGKFYPLGKVQISPNYLKQHWLSPRKVKIPELIKCISDINIKGKNGQIIKTNVHLNRRRDSLDLDVTFFEFSSLFDGNVRSTNIDQWQIMPGDYTLNKTIVLPFGVSLSLEPGVSMKLGPNVGILVRGDFIAIGGDEKIKISTSIDSSPFASVAVLGSKLLPSKVILDNFHISGGNEAIINNIYFSGQMSIHHADVKINRAQFSGSNSDDGLNIKYANITIEESRFFENRVDQLDCDFCKGQLNRNYFAGNESLKSFGEGTDGVDLSGSKVQLSQNIFVNLTDKAISVGELSQVELLNNSISYSNIGIAAKDGSTATLIENKFKNNLLDVSKYTKKKMYPLPKVIYAKARGSVL